MRIGLVVEGQDGLTWSRWRQIVSHAEQLGFASLFRSDHFFVGAQRDSLEAYLSFVVAATDSTSMRFGPLVTPVMFRSPVDVGRMAAHLDDLSGGRFVLGLGIGWYEPEHRAYGVPFPPVGERFDRLEEAIAVCRALWGELPASFDGRFYTLLDADCRPKPTAGRVPILIGGIGERRALKLVAQYADEWCSECLSVADYRHKVRVLEQHCEAVSRDPASIRRSMIIYGDIVPTARRAVRVAVKHALDTTGVRRAPTQPFEVPRRGGGFVVGGRQQIVDLLGQYGELGLQEAVFKYGDLHSDELAEYLASQVLPSVGAL